MSQSVVRTLVLKDLSLARPLIVGSLLAGLASLALTPWGLVPFFVGGVSYMVVLIVLNCILVSWSVIGERKDKIAPFILSLPVSTTEYGLAKMLSSLIGFVVPAVLLTGAAILLLAATPMPNGFIPLVVALSTHFLLYFCLFLSVGLLTESAIWITGVIILGNVSVTFILQILFRLASVGPNLSGEVAVWDFDLIGIILLDLGLSAAALVIALFVYSRKTEFV